MADVDTAMLSEQHADIRREAAEHRASIQLEDMKGFDRVNTDVLKSGWHGVDATKDARYDVVNRITNSTDTLLARSWDMGRDIVDNRTQIIGLGFQVRDGFVAAAKDMEINALKTQQVVVADGDRTRALINDLKYQDLNRALVERNAELIEEREGRRHWRHHADHAQFQGQWAHLQSQIQAFQSQLQETRQGLVNFGTMAGNAGQQSSTSNNVR